MRLRLAALLVAGLALPGLAAAQQSALGRWKTIDDATGKPKSVVEVYQARDGSLAGRVAEILDTKDGPNPACDKCKGALHGKPIKGMVILWGLKPDAAGKWSGGRVLDPENGKEYSSAVWLENPDRLRVRGYWGPFYRTQTWHRGRRGGG